jgi:hypothetical protein
MVNTIPREREGLRLIVDEKVAGADAGRTSILVDTNLAATHQIKHEMIAGVAADLARSARYLDPTIRE